MTLIKRKMTLISTLCLLVNCFNKALKNVLKQIHLAEKKKIQNEIVHAAKVEN